MDIMYIFLIVILFFIIILFYNLNNIKRFFGRIFFSPESKDKKKYVKICSNCGSINTKIPPAGMDLKMTLKDYCTDCKNRGMFQEVEESKIEEFRKKLKKK